MVGTTMCKGTDYHPKFTQLKNNVLVRHHGALSPVICMIHLKDRDERYYDAIIHAYCVPMPSQRRLLGHSDLNADMMK